MMFTYYVQLERGRRWSTIKPSAPLLTAIPEIR